MKNINSFIILNLLFVITIGCGDELTPKALESTTSGSVVSPGPGTSGPSLDDTKIYIELKNTFVSFLNSSETWNQTCEIKKDVGTNTHLDCIADIQEFDLYMNDIQIEYNFPEGMCEYVAQAVPWHWNDSAGHGPKEVIVSIDTSQAIRKRGTSDPTGTGCSVKNKSGTTWTACDDHLEIKNLSTDFQPLCTYDYTGEKFGSNCCFGDYNLTTHTDSDGNGIPDLNVLEETNWGGSVLNCIGGPGRSNWDEYDDDGYPNLLVTGSGAGISGTYNVTSNASTYASDFSFPATYFETVGAPHNHDGYVLTTISDLPYAVNPIDDLDGSFMEPGTPSYDFYCLDSSREIIHTVSLHIREWNTQADFYVFGSSSGATINPDVEGREGVDCDYSPIYSGFGCNDYADFKDILNSPDNVGAYTTDLTVDDVNKARRNYFPKMKYVQ